MRMAALLALTACSALLVKKAPDEVDLQTTSVDCTTSRAYPVADRVIGTTAIALGYALLRKSSNEQTRIGGAAMMPGGLMYLISAAMGFYRVGNCRDAKAEIEARP